jgi:hypothetical protein
VLTVGNCFEKIAHLCYTWTLQHFFRFISVIQLTNHNAETLEHTDQTRATNLPIVRVTTRYKCFIEILYPAVELDRRKNALSPSEYPAIDTKDPKVRVEIFNVIQL